MKTVLLSLDPAKVRPGDIRRMVAILRRGGLMVFPTDTFYGLGGDGLSRAVISRIYDLKSRQTSKPLLVLISDLEMARRLARDIPSVFWEIAKEFWPGPLTLAVLASEAVPRELCGGGESIALRLPDVSWLRTLVREAGFPLVATSANISGEGETSTPEEAQRIFSGKVELIVDGGRTSGAAASTVLDLTVEPPRIVREGSLPKARLQRYLKS